MVDIFLFRHAHVDYTPPVQITAHNPLTLLGHRMAAKLAERCDEWDLQYLFVSTMPRAQQTADAISARFPNLLRLDMPEFEEASTRDLVDFPGGPPPEDLHQWQDAHFAQANARMWKRAVRGLDEVLLHCEEQSLERIAIVSHGGPINALLRHWLGQDVVRLRTCWLDIDWTATSCLRYTPGKMWIEKSIRWINDARHIDDLRNLLIPAKAE